MIRHLRIFLVFLVLNTMIASIYLVWGVIRSCEKGQWKNYLFKAEVMLFCPGIGPMFFFVSNLIYKIFFRKTVDLADVIFSKERVTTFKRADIEAEGNLVPIEEALVVSDKGSQRALLLKVARGDIHNSLASISLALNSDDSETAHYAAAVLQDALNDFRLRVQELYEHMQENEEDAPEYAELMIEYMNNMLSQNVFDELEQKKYVGMMEEAGEVLYQKAKEKLTAVYIECICLRFLQTEQYDRMELWCQRSRELHPDALSTYTLQLKLYFTIQNKQKFFQVLNALKQSDIVIDRDTLALIRAFYESDGEKRKEEAAAETIAEDKTAAKATAIKPENTADKNENIKSEDVKPSEKEENIEKAVDAEIPQDIFKETKPEESAVLQPPLTERKLEEVKLEKIKPEEVILQNISKEDKEPGKKTISQNISEETKPAKPAASHRTFEEAELTRVMVSNVIEDLIAENAATQDINAQISQIIEELIAESEAREKEAAAVCQAEPAHDRQMSDKKKIDVLKTIARKHKIWTWLGLGIVIAGACLILYMKNKKGKEGQ